MNDRRVVITGLGAITCLGQNIDDLWQGLCEGRCGIDTIKSFDPSGFTCQLAGEVANFKINKHVPKTHRKAIKLMSRDIELAIIAANEAVESSGLITKATDKENINITPDRMAINVGAGLISCDLVELAPAVAKSIVDGKFDLRKWGRDGLNSLTPIWLLKYLPNMLACHVGIIHDFRGPSNSITSGEAGGQLAIAEATRNIARNDADLALAGGCEAKVNPLMMLRQCLLKRSTCDYNDQPDKSCRPFDSQATGSVFGEAGGLIVLEDMGRAIKRGVKIYAEIVGLGSSISINPAYEQMEPSGKGIQIAIESAMAEANISPDELDLIIPHGTGIPADDLAEATAIQNALGEAAEKIPCWPIKSLLSNTGAASSAIDVIVAAKAISEGMIGSAKNCDDKADGCKLNINGKLIQAPIRYALCCSYTFGGQTAAVILKNIKDEIIK